MNYPVAAYHEACQQPLRLASRRSRFNRKKEKIARGAAGVRWYPINTR
jgi:hypothetical protein